MIQLLTRNQLRFIFEKYRIQISGPFAININGMIEVKGSVKILRNNILKLPLKFGNGTGDFICKGSGLTTLKGCLIYVGGQFNYSDNELTTLEFGPAYVGKNYTCNENNLISLTGAQVEIIGRFNCAINKITSLEFCPKRVGKSLYCNHNQIVSLEGVANHIRKSFSY